MRQFTAVVVALAIVSLGALRASEPSAEDRDGVRLGGGFFADTVRRAVRGAAERLADASCAAILDEFTDRSGRVLRERLEALALDAPAYARQVLYYDGTNEALCRRNARLHAYTLPGSRVVRTCPSLAALALEDPGRAEAVVIHEVLHTLGLGEDPPSGREITARVERRCGR